VDPTPEEIHDASMNYLIYGVQPIWFDEFEELPGILRALK